MSCKYVIGSGAALDWAVASWREIAPQLEIVPLALAQDAAYAFDLSILDQLVHQPGATAFAAFGQQFLNLRRFELMGELKARGLAMPALVCAGAHVAASAQVGENALVGAGALIGPGCKVGFNAVIGAGANLGSGSTIGSSAWIEAGVVIGRGAKVGANATLGYGVLLGDEVEIGKLSVIDRPGYLTRDVAARTFIHAAFDHPIVVVEN